MMRCSIGPNSGEVIGESPKAPVSERAKRYHASRTALTRLRVLSMKSAAPVTPDAPTIKVLLIGRRPLSLAGLRAFIDAQPDCEVIGQRGHSAVPMVLSSDAPDVAVVDHGTRDTLESLTVLAEGHSHRLRTVVLTSGTDDETLLASAFRGGGPRRRQHV